MLSIDRLRSFVDLQDTSRQLRLWLETVANVRVHASTQRVVQEHFQEERPSLQALPAGRFGAVLRQERRVSSEGCVSVGGNYYSVPDGKAGKSVFFATLAELVDSMRKAEREGKLRERVKFFSRYSLLIVDEIGCLPLGSGGGNLFFQLVNACYERSAMVMTSNRGFGEWAEIFGDAVVATALLDRLLHHAVVIPIEGNSYRLREHAALVPETMRTRSSLLDPQAQQPIKRRPGRPPKEPRDAITG